jgi:hypothetical protein
MVASKIDMLIHVGYPKTGSSWIQRFLFDNPGTGFAPLFGSDAQMRSAIMRLLVLPNPLLFDSEACLEHFSPAAKGLVYRGLVPILSHERLAGTPHSGGYDSKQLARRLADVFPGAKVLIVVREQRSMIVSAYKQYVRNGGACALWGYLHPPRDGRIPLFSFEYFEYHRLVGCYVDSFGSSSVLVLPYELFRDHPVAFVRKIVEFAGAEADLDLIESLPFSAKENVALLGFSIALKVRLNRLIARRDSENPQVLCPVSRGRELQLEMFLKRLDSLVPSPVQRHLDRRLRTQVSDQVGHRYGESNRHLSAMMGMDLKEYGYEVA